jgi:hypothetical protein
MDMDFFLKKEGKETKEPKLNKKMSVRCAVLAWLEEATLSVLLLFDFFQSPEASQIQLKKCKTHGFMVY